MHIHVAASIRPSHGLRKVYMSTVIVLRADQTAKLNIPLPDLNRQLPVLRAKSTTSQLDKSPFRLSTKAKTKRIRDSTNFPSYTFKFTPSCLSKTSQAKKRAPPLLCRIQVPVSAISAEKQRLIFLFLATSPLTVRSSTISAELDLFVLVTSHLRCEARQAA